MKSQLPNKINYPECPRGQSHLGEPMSRVCVDPKCPNKTLLCSVCEQLDHKGHNTLPVKFFLQQLCKQRQSISGDADLLYYVAEMEKVRASCLSSIHSKKQEVIDKFNEIQARAVTFLDQLEQMARNLLHANSPAQMVINEFIYGTDINSDRMIAQFKDILKVFQVDSDKPVQLNKRLETLLQYSYDKQKRLFGFLNNITTDMNKHVQTISSIFQIDDDMMDRTRYFWSPTLKGAKIKINGNFAEQTSTQSAGQRFILMEPSLNEVTQRKKIWGIRVKSFGGWIGIGISLHNVIKNANYHFNYTVIGHGSYLISSNGYSWSHSVKQFNSTAKSFNFAVNDIVYIEYDPVANKLRFRKNESKEAKDRFELDVVPPPAGDSYHPSANLCNTNDSVELILPGKKLS